LAESLKIVADNLAARLCSEIESGENPVVLIDGYSGSGKSHFAELLKSAVFANCKLTFHLVHMDDLYPGWDGLVAGGNYLDRNIISPLSKGKRAEYQVWDWAENTRGRASEPGNGWRLCEPGTPVMVEGCGSMTEVAADFASLRIWIESPLETRLARWKERESEILRYYETTWGSQEQEHFEIHKPWTAADLVIEN